MRPFPKAPPRKAKRRLQVKSCVLTENEDAILRLREKEEKKVKKLEAQKAREEKKAVPSGGKGKVGLKGKEPAKKKPRTSAPPPESSTDEEAADDIQVALQLNDSSEYSTEEELEVTEPGHYPFLEKQPEVRDFEFFRP